MERQRFGFLGALIVLLVASYAQASQQFTLNAIFELSHGDTLIDPETIIKECSEALLRNDKEKPETVAKALYFRATAFSQLNKPKEAMKDLDLLCKLKPEDALARIARAGVLLKLGVLVDSMEEAKEAIRFDPNNARGYGIVANVYYAKRDYEDALEWSDKARAVDPKLPEVYYLRGVIYFEKQEFARCADELKHYLHLRPYVAIGPEVPYYMRATALFALGRLDEALNSLLMARRLNSDSIPTTWCLYMVYSRLEKPHLALRMAEELVALAPKDPNNHIYCASAYATMGEKKNAMKAIEVARSIGTSFDSVTLAQVAGVYFILQDYQEVLRQYDAALAVKSDCLVTIMAKASLLATCRDPQIRDGQQALKLALKADVLAGNTRDLKWETAMLIGQAYAECGSFKDAALYARKALEIGGAEFFRRKDLEEMVTLFDKGIPYRSKASGAK
jgi:tetratricopeptide (TPR) repeat protein